MSEFEINPHIFRQDAVPESNEGAALGRVGRRWSVIRAATITADTINALVLNVTSLVLSSVTLTASAIFSFLGGSGTRIVTADNAGNIGSVASPLPVANGGTGIATSPITLALGGTGATSLATGTIRSDGSVLSSTTSIPVTDLAAGSGATSSTFWRGDGSWAAVVLDPLTLVGRSTPSTPAAGSVVVFSPTGNPPLQGLSLLDSGGQVTDVSRVLFRYTGAPYKDVNTTAAETSIFASAPTIKGTTLGTNRTVELWLHGDYLNNVGSSQGFTFRIKYGATTVFTWTGTTAFTNSVTRGPWYTHGRLSASGATNAQSAFFRLAAGGGNGGQPGVTGTAALETMQGFGSGNFVGTYSLATEDSTADKTFDVTIQPSTNSANLSIRVFSVLVVLF